MSILRDTIDNPGHVWFNRPMSYYDDDTATLTERLDLLIKALDAASALYYSLEFPTLEPDMFGYTMGKKYARVWYDMSNGQRSVAFFVQMDNGDVWKADGWKKPVLNFVRGNVWSQKSRKALVMDKVSDRRFYAGF